MVIRSYGSWTSPSTSRRRTSGRDAGQLEPFAAHLLDEDRQLELAASADLERFARFGRTDLDGDVAKDLLLEPGLDLAAGHELAFTAGQRRGVDAEGHAQRWCVHVKARQGPRVGRLGQRVADRHLGQAGDADDVARTRLLDVDAVDAVGGLQARDGAGQRDRPARLHGARRVVRLLADDRDPLRPWTPRRSPARRG